MLGLSGDRIHGQDPPHCGAAAITADAHRGLDERVKQAVVAVVGQGFKAAAAATLQVHLRQSGFGELGYIAPAGLVADRAVIAAFRHDPMDQFTTLGVEQSDLGAVFIRDGEDRVAIVQPINTDALD